MVLDESEEMYRRLFELAPDPIVSLDLKGVITSVNSAGLSLSGYSEDELVGKQFSKVASIHVADIAKFLKIFSSTLRGIISKPFEIQYHRRDGTSIWADIHIGLIKVGDKTVGIQLILRDITERKKAQEEMIAGRKALEIQREAMIDGVCVSDVNGNFMQVNKAITEMLGFKSSKHLIGKPFLEHVAKREIPRIMEIFIESIKKKEPFVRNLEVTLRRIDGSEFPTVVNITNLWDEDGNLTGSISVIRDITERKRVEARLWQQTNFYFTTINSLTYPFYVINVNDYTIQFANSATGFDTNLKGVTCHEFTHKRTVPCTSSEHICPIEEVKKTKKPVIVEHIHHDKDGNIMIVEVQGYPIFDDDGNVIQIIEYMLDITERKKMEESLRQYSEHLEELVVEKTGKLVESEELYRSLVETSPEAITVTDLEGKLVMSNIQAARLYGFESVEESLTTGKTAFDYIAPEDQQRALDHAQKVLKTGSIKTIEYSMLRNDGSTFPAELSASVIKDSEGKPKFFIGIVRDLSEHKRLEEQLLKAKRMATIGETAGMVGHDLRNPLQAIVNTIYLANMKLESLPGESAEKGELKAYLDTVERQVGYMNKIVSDLLDYARPIHPETIETSIHQLIQGTLLSMEIPETIDVSVAVPKKIKLKVDPELMRRVFINLITNAVQAMPDGGKLTIKAFKKAGEVFLSVKDTGVGIREENLPKIFQPLFTTKSKGQGFGLSVCKRIIDAHGGEITVKSKVGKGTTITIKIPM